MSFYYNPKTSNLQTICPGLKVQYASVRDHVSASPLVSCFCVRNELANKQKPAGVLSWQSMTFGHSQSPCSFGFLHTIIFKPNLSYFKCQFKIDWDGNPSQSPLCHLGPRTAPGSPH